MCTLIVNSGQPERGLPFKTYLENNAPCLCTTVYFTVHVYVHCPILFLISLTECTTPSRVQHNVTINYRSFVWRRSELYRTQSREQQSNVLFSILKHECLGGRKRIVLQNNEAVCGLPDPFVFFHPGKWRGN